jgi:galactokinase
MNHKLISNKFREIYDQEPIIIRSPGRINLLGEHVDYNEGIVLPAAIDKAIWIGVAVSDNAESAIYAIDLEETFSFSLDKIERSAKDWPNYVLGVIDQLIKNKYEFTNFNAVFGGDIPLGAGLSSSAAMECGFLIALKELFNLDLDLLSITKMGQLAEHTYVGTKCGIMDQFANVFGKEDHIIRLDCRSLDYSYHKLALGSYSLVLLDTGVKHSLAESAYNKRREQCNEGVKILRNKFGIMESLRDCDMDQLKKVKHEMAEEVYKRCYYVVTEMQRVELAIRTLESDNLNELGGLMYETHRGLSNYYDVSCEELDFLVDEARSFGALGARMIGGGFGGCTLNLVKISETENFVGQLTKRYKVQFNLKLQAVPVTIKDGTSVFSTAQ